MTYVDEHGASVYGQRIRNLGESKIRTIHKDHLCVNQFLYSKRGIPRSVISPSRALETHFGVLLNKLAHCHAGDP